MYIIKKAVDLAEGTALYNARDVARALRCSRQYVPLLVSRGKITPTYDMHRHGGYLFTFDQIVDYMMREIAPDVTDELRVATKIVVEAIIRKRLDDKEAK